METEVAKIDIVDQVYGTLRGRHIPAAVLRMISDMLKQHDPAHSAVVPLIEAASINYTFSLMPTSFKQVTSLVNLTNYLASMMGTRPLDEESARDIDQLRRMLSYACDLIGTDTWHLDFMSDRKNRARRQAQGGGLAQMSRRKYNRLFRAISRLSREIRDMERQDIIYMLSRFAKVGFVDRIPPEMFRSDIRTAAFVAYYNANAGRRSVFTVGKQARSFDTVASSLLDHAMGYDSVCWEAIANVWPSVEVLQKTNEQFLVGMLSNSFYILQITSMMMEDLYSMYDININTMVVSKGVDSSTWNALAGSWNKARDYWMAACTAIGADHTFDHFLPGKAMRLMAGDVAWWHGMTGGDLDPDTAIWANLPKPWEVMTQGVVCNRSMIDRECILRHVNPYVTGWSRARSRTSVAPWNPTYDLVHGIEIPNPEFAQWLRKIGAFSGK